MEQGSEKVGYRFCVKIRCRVIQLERFEYSFSMRINFLSIYHYNVMKITTIEYSPLYREKRFAGVVNVKENYENRFAKIN